jgi:hypothetical protein
MSQNPESNDSRPCLHCLIGDLIDDFYAEYGAVGGEPESVDIDEVVTALAKTVADFTFALEPTQRREILENLTREIAQYETEFASAPSSGLRH